MAEKSLIPIAQKKKKELSQCRICGSEAFYSYFGVISCEACKVFFKRNAHYEQNRLRCSYNGLCEINTNNRHTCASCRLAKCLEKGMRPEMIRRSTINKTINTMSNTLLKSNQNLTTTSSSEKNSTSIDDSQWIVLLNPILAYQDSELLSITETIRKETDLLNIVNQSTLQRLLRCFYEITGDCLRSNVDITHLESGDRSILLQTAAVNITCMGGQMIFDLPQLINHQIFWKYLEEIYGKIIVDYHRLSWKFTETDMILRKLAIALFALCTNTRIFIRSFKDEYRNIHEILSIQDKYAEITWKYLIHKYGCQEAVKRYVHIIDWFLALTVFIQYAYNVHTYVNDVESLVEQTEMALILDDVDRTVNNNT